VRQFAAIDLVPAPAEGQGEALRLTGLRAPLPRGLYRLTWRPPAGDGPRLVELAFTPLARPHATVRLPIAASLRNGRASASFVLPEDGVDPLLGPAPEFTAGSAVRLRRLSSTLARSADIAVSILGRFGDPARLVPRTVRALALVREAGPAAFWRAVRRRMTVGEWEERNDRRYREWARLDALALEGRRPALAAEAAAFPGTPLVSVIMPVCDPPPHFLAEAIASVRDQIWPHWQLCIADDASTDPEVIRILDAAASDPRIRLVRRPARGNVSAASNSAIELATGEWIAFLDHDDRLAADALLEIARAIRQNPQARYVYSDEDKLDGAGERCRPAFKPDWNSEILHAFNFANHLSCYRADLVRRVGGLRTGFEGAQDYDLLLRATHGLEAEQIVHVPRVLYHWRMSPQSTAGGNPAKPYALAAGERALAEHLLLAEPGASTRLAGRLFQTAYSPPDPPPRVSIVIATRDRLGLLRKCVLSLFEKTAWRGLEIVIVDNGSREPATLEWLTTLETADRIKVLRDDRPFNYSALNNRGVEAASGEIVALLNNDVEAASPDWLAEMVSVLMRPGVGVVGARLTYPGGAVQHAGVVVNPVNGGSHWFRGLPPDFAGPGQRLAVRQRMSAVTGACLVTRRALFRELGGLDEAFAVAFNDVDYCLRAQRAGHRTVYTPFAQLLHHESASRGKDVSPDKAQRLYAELALLRERWGEALDRDPWAMPGLPPVLGARGWPD